MWPPWHAPTDMRSSKHEDCPHAECTPCANGKPCFRFCCDASVFGFQNQVPPTQICSNKQVASLASQCHVADTDWWLYNDFDRVREWHLHARCLHGPFRAQANSAHGITGSKTWASFFPLSIQNAFGNVLGKQAPPLSYDKHRGKFRGSRHLCTQWLLVFIHLGQLGRSQPFIFMAMLEEVPWIGNLPPMWPSLFHCSTYATTIRSACWHLSRFARCCQLKARSWHRIQWWSPSRSAAIARSSRQRQRPTPSLIRSPGHFTTAKTRLWGHTLSCSAHSTMRARLCCHSLRCSSSCTARARLCPLPQRRRRSASILVHQARAWCQSHGWSANCTAWARLSHALPGCWNALPAPLRSWWSSIFIIRHHQRSFFTRRFIFAHRRIQSKTFTALSKPQSFQAASRCTI